MKKIQIDMKKVLLVLILSLFVSLATQILLCDVNYNKIFNESESTNLNVTDYVGYNVVGDTYTVTNQDPQIHSAPNNFVSTILVRLREPTKSSIKVQIFYAKGGEIFSEDNSDAHSIAVGEQIAYIDIPYDKYQNLRLDIGSDIGQSFAICEIGYFNENISIMDKIASKLNFDVTFILFIISAMLIYYMFKNSKVLLDNNGKKLERIFLIFSFVLLTIWAIVQPFNSGPDEYMRYDLIQYLHNNNELPHGGEESIRNSIWGISYGFAPYLSGIISAIFMKIVSIFTSNSLVLILAARMAVVLFGVITIHYIIKISNKLFVGIYKWIFIILTSCLPQFMFLGTYMGNDMLSLMSIAMIIYYWIEGAQTKWCLRTLIGLSISLSICILSYYNAYPFVLMSVVYFLWTSFSNKTDKKIIVKNFIVVSSIVFVLSGWFFIRNAIIYDGDFLGLRTVSEYSEKYAIEAYKPSNRGTPLNRGLSLKYMLFDMGWINHTVKSFIGCFGYMTISVYNWIYKYYLILFGVGLVGTVVGFVNRKRKNESVVKPNNFVAFNSCLILASIITVLLSIYNSFTADFQPQGRYIMAILIPLMYFVAMGLSGLLMFIKSKRIQGIIGTGICFMSLYILILCFKDFILGAYL